MAAKKIIIFFEHIHENRGDEILKILHTWRVIFIDSLLLSQIWFKTKTKTWNHSLRRKMLDSLSLFLPALWKWWIQGTWRELCLNSHRFMNCLWCYLVLFCNNKIPLYGVWWPPWAVNCLINTIWVINPKLFFSWPVGTFIPGCPEWFLAFLPSAAMHGDFPSVATTVCSLVSVFFIVVKKGIEKTYWVAGSRIKQHQ